MPNSTPIRNASVREAVWGLQNTLAAESRAARADAERTADIASHYFFSRDDENCLLTAGGQAVQLAMTLTEKFTGTVRRVIVRAEDGQWVWLVEGMDGSPVAASDLIACVRQRIGAKLSCLLTGRVAVN